MILNTNFIQNKWLNLLVNENENICCVGVMINQYIVGEERNKKFSYF